MAYIIIGTYIGKEIDQRDSMGQIVTMGPYENLEDAEEKVRQLNNSDKDFLVVFDRKDFFGKDYRIQEVIPDGHDIPVSECEVLWRVLEIGTSYISQVSFCRMAWFDYYVESGLK